MSLIFNLLPRVLPAFQPWSPAKPSSPPSQPPELVRLSCPCSNLPELPFSLRPPGQSLLVALASMRSRDPQKGSSMVPSSLLCPRARAQIWQFRGDPRLSPFLTPRAGSLGSSQSNAVVLWDPRCSQLPESASPSRVDTGPHFCPTNTG